jgi:hypothetical protein
MSILRALGLQRDAIAVGFIQTERMKLAEDDDRLIKIVLFLI